MPKIKTASSRNALLCGVALLLTGCAVSPTSVGIDRALWTGPYPPCGERGENPESIYEKFPGNQELGCAMAEASALQYDYLSEIADRDTVRNLTYTGISVAGAILVLNTLDGTFGPAETDHPHTVAATVIATAFGLNNLFNSADMQAIYLDGAKEIICEQAIASSFSLDPKTYDAFELALSPRTSEVSHPLIGETRSAYFEYVRALSLEQDAAKQEDFDFAEQAREVILSSASAIHEGREYYYQANNNVPKRLRTRLTQIKANVNSRLKDTAPTQSDVEAFVFSLSGAVPGFLQSIEGKPEDTEPDDPAPGVDTVIQSSNDGDGEVQTKIIKSRLLIQEKGDKLAILLGQLQSDADFITDTTQSIAAELETLAASDQCQVEFSGASLSVSPLSIVFEQGKKADQSFTLKGGKPDFFARLSASDKGVTVDIPAGSTIGKVSYDGDAPVAELFIEIRDTESQANPQSIIAIRIREPAKAKPNPTQPPDNGEETEEDTEQADSQAATSDIVVENQRVAALQRALNRLTHFRIKEDGKYNEETYKAFDHYRKTVLRLSTPTNRTGFVLSEEEYETLSLLFAAMVKASLDDEAFKFEKSLSPDQGKQLIEVIRLYAPKGLIRNDIVPTWPLNDDTRSAVALFQFVKAANNSDIKVTGIVDETTYYELIAMLANP